MHSTNDNKPWIIVNNKYFIYKKYILTIKNNTNERRKQSLLDMLVLPSWIRSHWHKPAPRRIRSPRLYLYRASKSRFSVQHDILFHITQDMNAFSKDYAAEYKWGWIILRAPALKSMNTFIHILFLWNFILQIHFVSINGYRCDKYLDLQKIKNTFQECLQHVHIVTHECLQLIFSRWIKQRPVINDIRGLKTQMTYQGISIYWILRQWMQNLYRYCTWLKYYFYFNWIFVETQFKEKEALKLSV